MPILVILCLEKRVTQRHSLNPLHIRIGNELRVDVKENRHIHRLPRIQPLLFEAKTLDLAEIRGNLAGRNRVRRHADDVLGRLVRRRVESQCRFAGEDADFALLRHKFPREHVGDGAVEGYADAGVVGYWFEALGGVDAGIAAVRGGLDGLAAPASLLTDLED